MRQEPEGFEDFWRIWLPIKHKNDGRGDARPTFAKLTVRDGVDPRDIIDGARWYVRSLEPSFKYVPHSSTWLNREVWADLYLKEREFQARLGQGNVVPIKGSA